MATVERRQRPKVSAREHNAVNKAAQKRVDDLEPRLAAIIETILARAGTKAAARFHEKALRHFGASAANQDVSSGSTMIALKPRPAEAEAIADPDGDPPEILHVTLVYLGETDQPLQEIADALKPVAATYGPLSGVVGGYGTFDPPGVGILLPDVRGLVETRTAVAEALLGAGIDYARNHGFTPHISVNGDQATGLPGDEPGQPLHFDALHVVRGNDEEIAVPLVGVPALTAAANWTAPYPDELIDVDALVQQILAKTDPVRKAMLEQAMTPALEQAGLSFDVSNPLTAQMLAQSASQVTNIAQTTRANLMKIIGSAYQNGLTVPQTAGLIRDGMHAASKVRSTMIARTELARAVNGGSLAATQLVSSITGQKYNKVWHTAPGARYPRHENYIGLDGQTVPQDQTFNVGGDELQFPGDPDGEPGETINCRCTLTYTEAQAGEAAGLLAPPTNEAVTAEAVGFEPSAFLPKVKLPTAPPEVVTSNVETAAKALNDGKTVQLTQTSILNTFIKDLGKMAADAQRAGKSAPSLDLGKVSVKGTNLFTQDSLGVPRVEMPQLEGLPVPGSPASKLPTTMFEGKVSQWRDVSESFFKSLQDQGVRITQEEVNPESLKATQDQLNGPKVAAMMNDLDTGVPIPENIVVSSDNYILDGHHHWAAQIGQDYKTGLDVPHPMTVTRIDEPITTLLQQARDYAQEMGIPPQSAFHAETAAPVVEAAPIPVPSPVEIERSVDIGITPFRAGTDNEIGFYDSARYQKFVQDTANTSDDYGVKINSLDHVTGVWDGATEPSVSLRVNPTSTDPTDRVQQARAYAANLGQAYNQDAVMLFTPGPGDDLMATFKATVPQDRALAALKTVGLSGGRFTADGRLQVIGSGADFAKQLATLSQDLGQYDVLRGSLDIMGRDSYADALTAFREGVTAKPTAIQSVIPGQSASTAEHAHAFQEEAIKRYAADNHMTPEAYRAAATQIIKDLVRDHPQVRIRLRGEALEDVLRDGRFKSEFEVPGIGRDDLRGRILAERNLFGYQGDLPVEKRPIYGYLGGTADETGEIGDYGEWMANLDPRVDSRATFSIGDSYIAGLNRDLSPTLLSSPGIGSWDGSFDIVKAAEQGTLTDITQYVEVEIHGGLTLDDLTSVDPDYALIRQREYAQRVADAVESITEIAANYEGTELESPQVQQAGVPTEQPTSLDFSKALRDMAKNAAKRDDLLKTLISTVGLKLHSVDSMAGIDEILAKATL